MSDEIIKVKIGVPAGSGELTVGAGMPKFLAMLFPGWAAGLQIKNEAVQAIVVRWREGSPPTEDEVNWIADNVGESEARTLRRIQILDRAARTIEQQLPAKALPPVPTEPGSASVASGSTTARDWLSKFWDDAGLVSDQMVQEIYGRILASEAANPGTCSLRTLRTLRYMDRPTAERFKILLRGVLSSSLLLSDTDLLRGFGIPYELILDLDDAGLVDSSGRISKTIGNDPWVEQYGPWVIRAVGYTGVPVPAYVLTASGRELAKIAEVPRNSDDLLSIAQRIAAYRNKTAVTWAAVPQNTEGVTLDSLSWQTLP